MIPPDGIPEVPPVDVNTYLPSKSTVGFDAQLTVADNIPLLVLNDNAVK